MLGRLIEAKAGETNNHYKQVWVVRISLEATLFLSEGRMQR